MPQLVTPRLSAQLQRRTESYAYTDTAVYISAVSPNTVDEYGQPSGSSTSTTFVCSFTDKPKMERWRTDADVQEVEAEIRFNDADITPTKGGRIRITKRFSESVTERTFEITGIQDRGAFGYVCALKVVTI
jgi:hypothetical protein